MRRQSRHDGLCPVQRQRHVVLECSVGVGMSHDEDLQRRIGSEELPDHVESRLRLGCEHRPAGFS